MVNPIFEFTHEGKLFQIYAEGYVKIGPSTFMDDAEIIVNRIPLMTMTVEQIANAAPRQVSGAA